MTPASRSALTLAVFILFGVSSCSAGFRALIAADARKQVTAAEASVRGSSATLRQATGALEQARRVHLPLYLKGLGFTAQERSLQQAETLLQQARASRHPDRQVELVRRASREIGSLSAPLQESSAYLRRLDTALQRYQPETTGLRAGVDDTLAYLAKLEAEGYFPAHFANCRTLLQSAKERHRQAVALTKLPVHDGRPDYVKVYDTCLTGQTHSQQARQQAEAVPALRRTNGRRVAESRAALEQSRGRYGEARMAALYLEAYPAYRCISRVEAAKEKLALQDDALWEAAAENGMARQRFAEAAQRLSRLEGAITAANAAYRSAVENRDRITRALREIPSAERSALSEIGSAESRVRSYSYNSQSRAKSLISDAENAVSRGRFLRSGDPPASLEAFHRARQLADDAYSAVDTSSRDTGGSSSSGGSSGFGGGGFGGGGRSGGGSSGPSGGGFGGPSGGGFGGGGF
ncbi:MAG: hypothetical protein ACO1SX_01000 [Actinomycetota bacterium]